MPDRRVLALLALFGLGASCPPPATAQDPSLDVVEAALDSGRVEIAHAELVRWFEDVDDDTEPESVARARFLRGRMTANADSAEMDYIWVAIEGGGPYAAEAWLKLAQLRLMKGDALRATEDLDRLRADYPESPVLAESWLWSGFTLEAAGQLDAACEAWTRARDLSTGPADASVRAQAELSLQGCVAGSEQFTVQLGAFKTRDAAAALQEAAESAGTPVRIEVPDSSNDWYRVRSGRFPTRGQAEEAARRLTERGFEAIVVMSSP